MNRYKPIGWRNESYRHSLAAKGIRTSFADIPVRDVDDFVKKISLEKRKKDKNYLLYNELFVHHTVGDEPFPRKYRDYFKLLKGKELTKDEYAKILIYAAPSELLEEKEKQSGWKNKMIVEELEKRELEGELEGKKVGVSLAVKQDPFEFQSNNQEKIIHKDWFGPKEDLYKDNELRFVLEGSGDIFREFSIHRRAGKVSDFYAQSYIDEKATRIKKYLMSHMRISHSVDEVNRDKINDLKRLWAEQPYETKLQKKAIDLNLAILEGNQGTALLILRRLSKV